MTQTAMAVTYRLDEATRQDDARALKDQFAAAATAIIATPGLSWKISAIDAEWGVGLGLYLGTSVAGGSTASGPGCIARSTAPPGDIPAGDLIPRLRSWTASL